MNANAANHTFKRNPNKAAALCIDCGRGQSVHPVKSTKETKS